VAAKTSHLGTGPHHTRVNIVFVCIYVTAQHSHLRGIHALLLRYDHSNLVFGVTYCEIITNGIY